MRDVEHVLNIPQQLRNPASMTVASFIDRLKLLPQNAEISWGNGFAFDFHDKSDQESIGLTEFRLFGCPQDWYYDVIVVGTKQQGGKE